MLKFSSAAITGVHLFLTYEFFECHAQPPIRRISMSAQAWTINAAWRFGRTAAPGFSGKENWN